MLSSDERPPRSVPGGRVPLGPAEQLTLACVGMLVVGAIALAVASGVMGPESDRRSRLECICPEVRR